MMSLRAISSFLFFFAENIREVSLIIEQDSASSKITAYRNGHIEASFIYKQFGVSVVAALFEKHALTQGILSTTTDMDGELIVYLKNKLQYFVFPDGHVALPIKVECGTLKTLGKDRLAVVVRANYLRPGKSLLIINASTAVTYEAIEVSGIFLGKNISPGIATRFRTLDHFMKKLPSATGEDDIPLIGKGTEMVIQAGVADRIVYEMDGYIGELKVKYPDFLVFLTGGHSFYLERRLENSISADISLVSTGLSRILGYNAEN